MQKRVTLTLVDLDITQLMKMRECMHPSLCDRSNVSGAYRFELVELIDAMLDAGRSGKTVIKAPDLTL